MKKFFSALLKIIMVVAFVGILVFVTVAVINSRNIAYEAYNYVYTSKKDIDVNSLVEDIDKNVHLDAGLLGNEYTTFVGDAILQLDDGIDYYLDYLSTDNLITKGEQDRIINSYDSFVVQYNNVLTALDNYKTAYKTAQDEFWPPFATATVRGMEESLVRHYVIMFNSSYDLLQALVGVIQTKFDNNLTYNAQTHILKAGFARGAIDEIFADGFEKDNRKEISKSDKAQDYYAYANSCGIFSNKDVILNEDLRKFVGDLNTLNIYSFASNYDDYVKNLYGTTRARAESAMKFLRDFII